MTDVPRSERMILQEGNIQITDKRAVLGTKTYSMANITSVALAEDKPSLLLPIIFGTLGAFSLAASVCVLVLGDSVSTVLVLGLISAGLAALLYFAKGGPKYIVRIGSASGEIDGLISRNRQQMERIVKAINDAIVARS